MEISKTTLGATILITLLAGAGLGYSFRGHGKAESAVATATTALPRNLPDDVKLRQDDKEISLANFFSVFRQNPNRFKMQTAQSTFYVEGKIAVVGEANDVLGNISGFHIPLKLSQSDHLTRLGRPQSISVFVKGLTDEEIASFNVNDVLKVDCPKVRAFNENLVFDDCVVRREKK